MKVQAGAPVDEDFDSAFVRELIRYGGISPALAKKTKTVPGVEAKTALLASLLKQVKDEGLVIDEEQEASEQKQDLMFRNNKRAEEYELPNNFLMYSYQAIKDGSHPRSQQDGRAVEDAYNRAISTADDQDLALSYEKSLERLFNMYCRRIFWSLIKKDKISEIFKSLLITSKDMDSFNTFLKVLGNEAYITENKTYIVEYKDFLQQVVSIASTDEKYQPLVKKMINQGIIEAYGKNLKDIQGSRTEANQLISKFFQSESKAAQLTNPYIIVPLLQQVIKVGFEIIKDSIPDLLSILVTINNLFIGSRSLKEKFWWLIIQILDKAIKSNLDPSIYEEIARLPLVKSLFKNFDEQDNADYEESRKVKK